jgi:hypothetical protein
VTTARPGGILLEISPLENSHDLLWDTNDTNSLASLQRHLKRDIHPSVREAMVYDHQARVSAGENSIAHLPTEYSVPASKGPAWLHR